jgi:hypothetical protein
MTRAAVAVLALCAGLSAAQEPLTQEARRKALLEGTHVFRRILHDHKFEQGLEAIDDVSAEPGRTLLVVLGDLNVLTKVPGGLEQFLADGGAALLASDRPITDPDARRMLSRVAGVTISGDSIISSGVNYMSREFCPLLSLPWAGATPNLYDDTAQGERVKPVATNVPSMLFVTGRVPGITPLLVLPNDSLLDAGPRGLFRPLTPLFAVGGDSGTGRLLVMADHSVFINEMMLPEDTGNVEFAYNCVRYLQDGKRDRVLFLEDGVVQTRLAIPLKSPRISPEELMSILYARRNELLVEAERWLARQEDDNNALEGRLMAAIENRVGWMNVLFGLVVAATLAGLMFVAYRLGVRDRYGPDRSTPLLLSAAGKALPAGPLAEQRVEALLAAGDVREPLRDLARHWLADVAIAPPRSAKDNLPPVATKGWWAGWRLRGRLGRVWRLAAGAWPGRITPRALAGWQRELDELRSAHERGEWHARNSG